MKNLAENPEAEVNFVNILTRKGARIRGRIRLDQPGRYRFAAVSNDGVSVRIGGALLIEDPDVHADRQSPTAEFDAHWGQSEFMPAERWLGLVFLL